MPQISAINVQCSDTECPLAGAVGKGGFVAADVIRHYQDGGYGKKVKILLIGEGPGNEEHEYGRPFVGRSGRMMRRGIRRIMRKLGEGNEVNWALSNTVRCRPVKIEKDEYGIEREELRPPTAEERRHCRHFLERDIEYLDPDVLVTLGGPALATFVPTAKGVSKYAGKWFEEEIAGRKRIVFCTWHPAYIGRATKATLPVWLEHLETAFRLAAGWRPDPSWAKIGKSKLLRTTKAVHRYLDFLQYELTKNDIVGVDIETDGLGKVENKIGTVQFAHNNEEAYVVPLDHPQTPFTYEEREEIKRRLGKLFTEPVSFKWWVAHGGKFEQIQIGTQILRGKVQRTIRSAPVIDTMAFLYLLNENRAGLGKGEPAGTLQLKPAARHYLRFEHYDVRALSVRSEGELMDLELESPVPYGEPGYVTNLTDYGGMDAYVTRRLFFAFREQAQQQGCYESIIKMLVHWFSMVYRLLAIIETNGFWANMGHLRMLQDPRRSPIIKRIEEIAEEIKQLPTAKAANRVIANKASGGSRPMFGVPWLFDPNKVDHRLEWLINQCELKPLAFGKSGKPSIDKGFLNHYNDSPEVQLLMEDRGLKKLVSGYINQLLGFLDPKTGLADCRDGRIRCDIFVTSTVTGRASAANPNMQQQVKSDSEAKTAIKNIFQAEQPGVQEAFHVDFSKGPPGPEIWVKQEIINTLVQLDFMANEVRWWAILSKCPSLAEAFNNGYDLRQQYRKNPHDEELKAKAAIEGDIHRQTAALMYEVLISKVDKIMRSATKTIVFGWMFGRGIKAIAEMLHKDFETTERLINTFASKFPTGKKYLDQCVYLAQRQWYIDSPLRRRRIPGFIMKSGDMIKEETKVVAEADRMAKNSPIQGIASDASFIGSSLFADYIEQHEKPWLIQNVVHDSCVYQVPINEVEESVAVAEQVFTHTTMGYMNEHWGIDFPCPIEVEFEIGNTWGNLAKWDFSPQNLSQIIDGLRS